MSIFGSIMNAIFKGPAKAITEAASAAVGGGSSPAAPAAAPMSQVDVAAVLTGLAAQNKEKLDWRRSIVDLMKLSSSTAASPRARSLRRSCTTPATRTTRLR